MRVRSRPSLTGWGPRIRAHKLDHYLKMLSFAQNDHKNDCFESPGHNAASPRPMANILRKILRMDRAGWSQCPLCSSFSVYCHIRYISIDRLIWAMHCSGALLFDWARLPKFVSNTLNGAFETQQYPQYTSVYVD